MKLRHHLLVVLGLSLLISACNGPTSSEKPPAGAEAPTVEVVKSGPRVSDAFQAAFSGAPPAQAALNEEMPGETLVYSPSAVIATRDDDILISEGKNEEDFHAASGGLAVHFFPAGARGVPAKNLVFVPGGFGFGSPPKWQVRTDLFSQPALFVEGGFTQGGCSVQETDIFEIVGSTLLKRASVMLHHESPSGEQTSGQIEPDVRGEAFTVRYTGAFAKPIRFVRSDGAYLPDTSLEDLPSC